MVTAEQHLQRGCAEVVTWFGRERDRLSGDPTWARFELAASRWGAAAVVAAAALLGGLLQLLSPSADAEAFLQAANHLLSTDWANTFADPFFQIGPLHLLVVSVGSLLAHLTGASPYFCSGAVQAGLVTFLALVTARATVPAVGLGSAVRRGLLVGSVVVGGPLASAALHGHDEEIVVALLLILAASRRRPEHTALLIGAAGCFKLWGLLGLPLLFIGATTRSGLKRSLIPAAAVVGSYLPFYLAGHVGTFDYIWRVAAGAPVSALIAVGEPYDWPLRLAQGAVSVAAGWWLARRSATGLEVLTTVCCARLLLDPNPFSYYGIALLLLFLHWSMSRERLVPQAVGLLAVPVGVVLPDLLRAVPTVYRLVEVAVLILTHRAVAQAVERRRAEQVLRASAFAQSGKLPLKPLVRTADASGVIESQGQ